MSDKKMVSVNFNTAVSATGEAETQTSAAAQIAEYVDNLVDEVAVKMQEAINNGQNTASILCPQMEETFDFSAVPADLLTRLDTTSKTFSLNMQRTSDNTGYHLTITWH